MTVTQLIQFLHSVEESGALSVTHGSGAKAGKIMFNHGDVIDAQCEDVRGEAAVREMIPFHDGIFAFARQAMHDHPPTIALATMELLMNVAKDVDEANEQTADVEPATQAH